MKKVLIATEKPFAKEAINQIKAVFDNAGYQMTLFEKYEDKKDLIAAVKGHDAMIVRSDKIDNEVISAADQLKIVVRAGAGYDNVNLDSASSHDVCVMNTPGQNSNAVAELAAGFLIMGARKLFSGKAGSELRGKTLALHGYGYIARNLNRIARGFGMKTIVFTRYSKPAAISQGIEVADSLEDLYSKADMVSIHVPARGEHIKSVSKDVLSKLKDGAVIINTARKEVINENDLLETMAEKSNISYLSDIAPDMKDEFTRQFPERIFFSPKKIGAQTAEANINAGVAAAEQIVAYLEKGEDTFRVNK